MPHPPFHILINAHSATAHNLGRDKIEALIAEADLPIVSLDICEADDFPQRLRSLIESPHSILIGGGDGTIAMASAYLIDKDKPFGILPMGTMNLLATDLHLPFDLADCLRSYRKATTIKIDAGLINERPFLC